MPKHLPQNPIIQLTETGSRPNRLLESLSRITVAWDTHAYFPELSHNFMNFVLTKQLALHYHPIMFPRVGHTPLGEREWAVIYHVNPVWVLPIRVMFRSFGSRICPFRDVFLHRFEQWGWNIFTQSNAPHGFRTYDLQLENHYTLFNY